jgi:hypothetical protein
MAFRLALQQFDVTSTVYTVPALLDALEAHLAARVGDGG